MARVRLGPAQIFICIMEKADAFSRLMLNISEMTRGELKFTVKGCGKSKIFPLLFPCTSRGGRSLSKRVNEQVSLGADFFFDLSKAHIEAGNLTHSKHSRRFFLVVKAPHKLEVSFSTTFAVSFRPKLSRVLVNFGDAFLSRQTFQENTLVARCSPLHDFASEAEDKLSHSRLEATALRRQDSPSSGSLSFWGEKHFHLIPQNSQSLVTTFPHINANSPTLRALFSIKLFRKQFHVISLFFFPQMRVEISLFRENVR